jgi:hypothetical protein
MPVETILYHHLTAAEPVEVPVPVEPNDGHTRRQ